jgi:glycosyltransferase involved in cell wall biosynthesis/LmbE family N-acetylglucosaminyl deacetylase
MKLQESDLIPYQPSAVPSCAAVWVFAPHPDDEVFGCGGSLALHRAAGHQVHVVLLTEGEQQADGATTPSPRLTESEQAAKWLGDYALHSWRLPDRGVRFDEALIQRIRDCIARGASVEPVLVYAPSLWEAHPDHRACAMAVLEAIRREASPHISLWFYEVSLPLRANRLVDVSAVWAQKQAAMQCFTSQEAVLPYAQVMAALNRYRSLTIQPAEYAEAFEAYDVADLGKRLIASVADQQRQAGIPVGPQDCPLVTVMIRTQGRLSLERSIASVRTQTYTHWELLLVNATAGEDLASRFPTTQNDPAIRWVSASTALTRPQAANVGLDHAQGAWLMFLDDDDWLYPDHLSKLVSATWTHPQSVAVYSDIECVDPAGKPTGVVFSQAYSPRELMYGNFLPIHSVLFHRRVLERGVRFDPQFDLYEDWDFWLQVERQGALTHVPGVSAAYLIGAGSGAGVTVDWAAADQATAQLFNKWQTKLDAHTFKELVRRSLERRELQRQIGQVRHELTQTHRQLHEAQEHTKQALSDAHLARADAHLLRQAHDQACHSRDLVFNEVQRARAELDQAREQQWVAQREMEIARQDRDHQRHLANLAQTQVIALQTRHDADTVWLRLAREGEAARQQELQHAATIRTHLEQELHTVHARLYQAELRGEQQQVQLQQLQSSRSWRITKPLRWATRLLGAVRRLGLRGTAQRMQTVLQQEGVAGLLQKAEGTPPAHAAPASGKTYADWIAAYDSFDPSQRYALAHELAALKIRPLISIVMPVYNTLEADLRAAIASVQAQLYTEWELCICDDASTKPHVQQVLQELSQADVRIKVVRREQNGHISAATNTAIESCTGAYIALLDHDDTLAPHALLRVVQWLQDHPEHQLLYSDEDKIGLDGQRFDPYFKPDFNLGLLRSHNYLCHFAVYQRELMLELGGPRVGFEGAQDYDLALRAVDHLKAEQIGHIPHVLYHWRVTPGSTAGGHQEKSYAFLAGVKALEAHLERRGLDAHIEEAPEAPGMYRVCWHIKPEQAPLVSIVVPTRNGEPLLRMCLDTLQKTTYPAFEVVVVDNGSDDAAALALMAEREAAGQIRVLRDDSPFNFSALNNRAIRQACKGDWLVLMNNDIEITHPEWLSEMMGIASEPGVGCVGARLWYPDGRLQHGGVIMVCGVAGHAHKYLPRGRHGYMGRAVLAQDFLGVTAACLLVNRAVFEAVGGLDETLKVAFNDVDFCLKVHHAGYRNVWTPYAELVHHESVTRGHEDTPEKQQRFAGEIAILQKRWPNYLAHDPCYSPNLTNQAEDFSYAWPPRRPLP